MYYIVFFDIDLPKNENNAMYKRVHPKKYANITDGITEKTVQLIDSKENMATYKILSIATFNILNSVDNTFFAICHCKKVK